VAAIVVRLAEERGIHPLEVTTELLDEAAVAYMDRPAGLSATALADALDPTHFVSVRTLLGGPAPAEAARQIAEHRTELEDGTRILAERQDALSGAEATLEAAIDALVAV
jgi:argininosuccinate lyase